MYIQTRNIKTTRTRKLRPDKSPLPAFLREGGRERVREGGGFLSNPPSFRSRFNKVKKSLKERTNKSIRSQSE